MSLLIKLGLKSIGRNRLRSILTITAVVICAGGTIIYGVAFAGIMNMFFDSVLNQVGHVRLVHKQLAKDERLGKGVYFVPQADAMLQQVRNKLPDVRAVVPRIDLGAFFTHTVNGQDKQAPARGLGIMPQAETEVMRLHEKLNQLDGSRMINAEGCIRPRHPGCEILLGRELAERLQAKVGSDVVLLGQTVDDSPSAVRLKVVGIFSLGNAIQDRMFFVSLPTAQYFLDIPGQVSMLLVFTDALWRANRIATQLRGQQFPPEVIVQTWTQTPFIAAVLPVMQVMLFVLGGIVILIGGIGLLNTMMMAVIERRHEIGLMMAMGLTPRKVAGVFLIEGVIFGVIGAVIGTIIALIGSIPLVVKGLSFGDSVSKVPFPISTSFKGAITTEVILLGLIVGILVTVVGSFWPAIQASRMDPIQALRKS
jgi:ABC-type lipoprotein release transport system permease subunit